jgi:hypothetical protein
MPSYKFAPIIRKGARVRASNGQYFETDEDIDFSEQFNSAGESNMTITPIIDANNNVQYYRVTKTVSATAGISKVYKMILKYEQVVPFMEIIIPETSVMDVESIIVKDGASFQSDPQTAEFFIDREFVPANKSISGNDT